MLVEHLAVVGMVLAKLIWHHSELQTPLYISIIHQSTTVDVVMSGSAPGTSLVWNFTISGVIDSRLFGIFSNGSPR